MKHALGGNEGGKEEHHPFAAGMFSMILPKYSVANVEPAASGAAATITSDALMNPFDGTSNPLVITRSKFQRLSSHQTTHAAAWFDIQIHRALCPDSVPTGGIDGILCLVSYNALYDSSIHGSAVHGV